MKVAVLGSGTAGCIFSMLACKNLSNAATITCIYDPNIPTIEVGETASPGVLDILQDCLDFEVAEDLNKLDGTLRTCVKHFWADANKDFYIKYDRVFGLHFNSTTFSSFVLNRIKELYPNKFFERHANVTSVDKSSGTVHTSSGIEQFDLVVDCRGFADKTLFDTGEILRPKFEAVNSVILWPEHKQYNEYYTTAQVHNNGWMFGVPLTFRKAWGYLYNNSITSYEEAKEDFARIKGLDKDTVDNCRHFSWEQYYRVKALDGKVLYLGNNLYFFEPSGAIPLHYYLVLSKFITEDLESVKFDERYEKMVNDYHVSMMNQHLDITAIGYAGKNKISSPFWDKVRPAALGKLASSSDWKKWVTGNFETPHYFTHPVELMNQYTKNFELELSQFF